MLILLVIVMLVGSYLAGNIPLVANLSEEKLKITTVFGAGLLVGTALTVIIPEGIRALYSEKHDIKNSIKLTTGDKTISPSSIHITHLDEEDHDEDHSSTIGLSLVIGFVFMMLIDQISSRRGNGVSSANDRNITATLGLVVHAAADGIALGAAATTSHQDVEMIVFLAIMLHKAPAAFGLVSFLLHEGVETQRIRKHLMIFSLSAPLLTLLTYFGIGQEQKETLNSFNATGIAMLFSAGTFLYVATVHVLPELTHNTHAHGGNNSSVRYSHLEDQISANVKTAGYHGLRNMELFILIFGAFLPLVITVGHHH